MKYIKKGGKPARIFCNNRQEEEGLDKLRDRFEGNLEDNLKKTAQELEQTGHRSSAKVNN